MKIFCEVCGKSLKKEEAYHINNVWYCGECKDRENVKDCSTQNA